MWLRKTILIYIVAQFAHFILNIVLEYFQALLKHEAFDTSFISWRVLIIPRLALWYLVCLMYWRLLIWRLFSNTNDIKLLCISCILALFSGFVPVDREFAFQRALSFFPFFVLGFIFKRRALMPKLNQIPLVQAFAALIIGLTIARFISISYVPQIYMDLYGLVSRVIHISLGIFLCFAILRIARIDFVARFAKYGVYTLWIYVGHTYLIKIGEKVFPFMGVSFNLITAVILACFYCFLFIFLANFYNARWRER